MSWAKPMLLMVVLGGILYGVYVVLNKGPAPTPPAAAGQGWDKPIDIQLGSSSDGPPQIGMAPPPPGDPTASTTGSAAPGNAPPFNGSSAPPFNGASAPPFNGASAAPGAAAAPPGSVGGAQPPAGIGGDSASAAPPAGIAPPNVTPGSPDLGNAAAPADSFPAALAAAKAKCNEGHFVEALRMLTKWQDAPQLTPDQSRELFHLLSELAGTVVYSRQHLLEPAYRVQAGDTVESIAKQYSVPPQLLAKINGVDDTHPLIVGEQLKVLRGPFNAHVDLQHHVLTITVDGCYAGRFALVGVGDRVKALDGQFDVSEKQLDPGGPSAAAGPIHHWVGIGSGLGIVGTTDPASIHPSGVNLNARDAEDIYDILSVGSRVIVRR